MRMRSLGERSVSRMMSAVGWHAGGQATAAPGHSTVARRPTIARFLTDQRVLIPIAVGRRAYIGFKRHQSPDREARQMKQQPLSNVAIDKDTRGVNSSVWRHVQKSASEQAQMIVRTFEPPHWRLTADSLPVRNIVVAQTLTPCS